MNDTIDDALARIAGAEAHPGLAGLEDRVMLAIAHRPPPGIGAGAGLGAAAFALALGVASNVLVPSSEARAARTTAPFGTPGPLAPSSLLLEPR